MTSPSGRGWKKREWLSLNGPCMTASKRKASYTPFSLPGFRSAYNDLKPPIDTLSFLRPIIVVLYLFLAACFFRAAVDRRKSVVFGLVLLAALIATGVNVLWLKAYFEWRYQNLRLSRESANT